MNHIKKMPFIKYAAPTKKQGNVCDKCVYPSLQKKAVHKQRNFVCTPQVHGGGHCHIWVTWVCAAVKGKGHGGSRCS